MSETVAGQIASCGRYDHGNEDNVGYFIDLRVDDEIHVFEFNDPATFSKGMELTGENVKLELDKDDLVVGVVNA